jgi:hypothetical protein
MSSKGRKKKDIAGSFSEFYPTPPWVTHRFIERAVSLPKGSWLEPCAGNGDIIQAVNDVIEKPVYWHANEIRSETESDLRKMANQVTISDFIAWETPPPGSPTKFDVIITNPPFSLALPIIKKSLELADYVVVLVRLNFIGSTKRTAFFKEMMPDIYVIPERPSFDGEGADSIEYAWLQWNQPESRKRSRGFIELLGNTPLEIRKSHKPKLAITDQMKFLLATNELANDEPEQLTIEV